MVERVHESTEALGDATGRFARENGDTHESAVPAKTLLARLEKQAAQLAVVRSKRDETRRALRQERGATGRLQQELDAERSAREQIEAQLVRERAEREEAERAAEEAHITANALGGQLQLLRAQLETLEKQAHRRRLFRRRRHHRH
jgi:septal ring factor EnvC (AmiA/AmiB activator)